MAERKTTSIEGLKATTRRIWLAGLGALAEAEKKGDELFQSLVEQGEKHEDELRTPFSKAADALSESMSTARERASSTFRDLESTFDRQAAAAMKRAGIASREELESLRKEVKKLKAQLEGRTKKKAPRKKAAKKKPSRRSGT